MDQLRPLVAFLYLGENEILRENNQWNKNRTDKTKTIYYYCYLLSSAVVSILISFLRKTS